MAQHESVIGKLSSMSKNKKHKYVITLNTNQKYSMYTLLLTKNMTQVTLINDTQLGSGKQNLNNRKSSSERRNLCNESAMFW